ncbi:M48 family metalloprotease [Pyxidicoccus parkwayensis]|uniref:M48 family metalloprotease n=1 Tax=Pyxidicoccus parkwayensis TaxID=2813578 RepID=A0ABX7NJM1_9BACT|nr:M48 family metallopeptidase [Pyxidicoccus parkwaysis]QSQ18843.1 M48 family metalloprotease [Pyxidicoccus parkwaysis]
MYAIIVAVLLAQAGAGAEAPDNLSYSAELQPIFDRAFETAQGPRPEDALLDVKKLLEEAPENPRTYQVAGLLFLQKQQPQEAARALNRALMMGPKGELRAELLALLGIAYVDLERFSDAEDTLNEALELSPDQSTARYQAAVLAGKRKDFARMRDHAVRVIAAEPNSGAGHSLLAAAALGEGDLDRAQAEVKRARELGLDDVMVRAVEAGLANQRPSGLPWEVPLGMVLFLGLSLLGTWAAGRALSSVQLDKLRAGRVHLMRAEQTASERRVDRLYSAVLWYASLLFYAAVPMLVVLLLMMTGGLFYGLIKLHVPSVKLMAIVGVIGVGGLISIFRGLFAGTSEPEDGRTLEPSEAPELFRALAEVAEVAGVRKVDRVLLSPGVAIGVREAGGRFQVLLGRGERLLYLGLAAVRGLTVSELKAVLAHEYGHFSHGETRLTPIIGRIQTQVVRTIEGMQQLGWASLNPVYWFLRAYFFVYLQVTAGHGRRRELLADRVSALAYGGDTFGRALTKAIESGDTFQRGLTVAAGLREAGRPTRDLYRTVDATARGTPAPLRALTREELLSRPVDAYDSHPPPSERVQRVEGIAGKHPVEDAPALSLFADPEKLAEELGGEVLTRLDDALTGQGIAAREPVAATGAELDRLAEAIALHQSALSLAERDHPDALVLLQDSLSRLEAAAGAGDAFLGPPLVSLARLQLYRQEPEAARATLQRAIGLFQALPGHEDDVAELQRMLGEVPERQAA